MKWYPFCCAFFRFAFVVWNHHYAWVLLSDLIPMTCMCIMALVVEWNACEHSRWWCLIRIWIWALKNQLPLDEIQKMHEVNEIIFQAQFFFWSSMQFFPLKFSCLQKFKRKSLMLALKVNILVNLFIFWTT